jgi:hypothetical protein
MKMRLRLPKMELLSVVNQNDGQYMSWRQNYVTMCSCNNRGTEIILPCAGAITWSQQALKNYLQVPKIN